MTSLLILFIFLCKQFSSRDSGVQFWLTTANKSVLLERQADVVIRNSESQPDIEIRLQQRLQSIDGFGWCLTGGSASLIHSLPPLIRKNLLQGSFYLSFSLNNIH